MGTRNRDTFPMVGSIYEVRSSFSVDPVHDVVSITDAMINSLRIDGITRTLIGVSFAWSLQFITIIKCLGF